MQARIQFVYEQHRPLGERMQERTGQRKELSGPSRLVLSKIEFDGACWLVLPIVTMVNGLDDSATRDIFSEYLPNCWRDFLRKAVQYLFLADRLFDDLFDARIRATN